MAPWLILTGLRSTEGSLGILFLLLSISSSVIIANLLRYSEGRGASRRVVIAANYLVTFVGGGALWLATRTEALPGEAMILGAVTGITFVAAFLLMIVTIGRVGIAIPVSVTRLAVVSPVVVSIIAFGEKPDGFQYLGLALALAALVMLGWAARQEEYRPPGSRSGSGWLLLWLFVCMGINGVNLKIFEELFSVETHLYGFLTCLFGSAMIMAWITVFWRRKEPVRQFDFGMGLLLGIPNFLSSAFFILALRYLPGIVVFPANDVGIVLVSAATGVLFWKETLTWPVKMALLLAAVAIAILNT